MAEIGTISELATGGGTLILALATFASVRSANRSAHMSERSLLAGLRPLIIHSRNQDPEQKIGFGDDHFVKVAGGQATAEVSEADGNIYLTMSLRNAGAGLAVLDGWFLYDERVSGPDRDHQPAENFRRLNRDIYVPPNDLGFWQGAFRDPDEEEFKHAAKVIQNREPFTLELIYTDLEGGQRSVTRFGVIPIGDDDKYLASVSRHWILDGHNPR